MMNLEIRHKSTLILAIAIIGCLQFTVIHSQVIDCARLIMKVAKGLLRIYGQCSKEFLEVLDSNIDEYQRRVDCVMKCVMIRVNILDEFHKVTNVSLQAFFDKFIPEDFHEIGHMMVEGCTEEYSPLMDNEDDTCTPYGDFVKCVQSVISEAC